jgi:Ankyrin repeats (many copies)
MLHTAAMHNRADCIPLLLTKGASVTALDAQDRSPLLRACLHSNMDTVQALIDSGGWLDGLGAACLAATTFAGNHELLSVLIELTAGPVSSINYCNGCTLLHVAAAYGRLECAGLLIRQGCDTNAVTDDGQSVLDVAFANELLPHYDDIDLTRPVWAAREATAMMLLKLGVEYDASKVVADSACAVLIKQYIDAVRAQAAQQQLLLLQHLDVHTDAIATTTTAAAATSAAGGSSANITTSTSNATVSSQKQSEGYTVRVQLVHAEAGEKSKHVYTVHATLLAKLQSTTSTAADTTSADTTPNVLLNMLAPAGQWSQLDDSSTATAASAIKFLTYDGKCSFS